MPIQYQASFKGSTVTRETPRRAALAFFERDPSARKCNVQAGEVSGAFFTARFNAGGSWRDVTRKSAATLPDIADTAKVLA